MKGEVVGITQGTFKGAESVYDKNGKIIGFTDNGGDGNLFKAVNIKKISLYRFK